MYAYIYVNQYINLKPSFEATQVGEVLHFTQTRFFSFLQAQQPVPLYADVRGLERGEVRLTRER